MLMKRVKSVLNHIIIIIIGMLNAVTHLNFKWIPSPICARSVKINHTQVKALTKLLHVSCSVLVYSWCMRVCVCAYIDVFNFRSYDYKTVAQTHTKGRLRAERVSFSISTT